MFAEIKPKTELNWSCSEIHTAMWLFLLFSFRLVETEMVKCNVEDNGKSAPQTFSFRLMQFVQIQKPHMHKHLLYITYNTCELICARESRSRLRSTIDNEMKVLFVFRSLSLSLFALYIIFQPLVLHSFKMWIAQTHSHDHIIQKVRIKTKEETNWIESAHICSLAG